MVKMVACYVEDVKNFKCLAKAITRCNIPYKISLDKRKISKKEKSLVINLRIGTTKDPLKQIL